MNPGVDIDRRVARPADPLGDYANAFGLGRRIAALPPAAGGTNAMARGTADAGPADPIGALAPAQRATAARRAELRGAMAAGVIQRPYEERRAIIAHLAPALQAQGMTAAAIGSFDPTDEALAGLRQTAAGLLERLSPGGTGR
ncbi:MAG TPA: hypothetical protein VG248_02725 [Caulobacteraceae bacterium]|jgi:hypothetical protein|nr:hypothetical protein [Caulobacteraceae bacterium]